MSKYSYIKEAMEIFMKYDDDWIQADHDVLYGPILKTPFSEEDKARIKELGWHYSEEYDCWACFC